MALQLFKIADVTIATPQANITFSSIPSGYTDLLLVCSLRTDRAANNDTLTLQLNSTNITGRRIYGNGATAASDSTPAILPPAASATSNTFGNTLIYIPNYTSTSTYKSISIDDVGENNTTSNQYLDLIAGLYSSNTAVTSITLDPDNGNIIANSTATLYGVL